MNRLGIVPRSATSLAAGACADGSGNWYPLHFSDGSWEAICPSDPRYEIAKRQARRGIGEAEPGGRALGVAVFVGMGLLAAGLFWLARGD